MRAAITAFSLLAVGFCILPTQDSFAEDTVIRPTVSQWIQAAETGLFECQVVVPTKNGDSVALSNAMVEIKGRSTQKAIGYTDEHGVVRIPGISPGDYTLSVWAEGYVGWESLHFVASDDDRFGTLPSQAIMTPASISADLFFKMATPYVSVIPELSNASEELNENGETTENLTQHSVKGIDVPEVLLRDGGIEGQLTSQLRTADPLEENYDFTPVENHLIFLVDQQQRIRQTVTDGEGRFSVENATAGLHSIIVVGRSGISASSLMIADPTQTTKLMTTDGKRFVADLESDSSFSLELSQDFDVSGLDSDQEGMMILPEGTSGGTTGNLIGASLLGTAAVIGTSAYTTATADSESTDPGGI